MKSIPRKAFLLAAIVILAAIYILQLAFDGKSRVRVISAAQDFDRIEIFSGGTMTLALEKMDGGWRAGESKHLVSENRANGIVNSLNEIRLLGKVSSSASDKARYGLDDSSRILAVASAAGSKVVSLKVGKSAGSNSICYVELEGQGGIYLAQGDLSSTFSQSLEDIRDKNVFRLDTDKIVRVEAEFPDDKFSARKFAEAAASGDGDSLSEKSSWRMENSSGDFDGEKISSWVKYFASVDASKWLDDGAQFFSDDEFVARLNVFSEDQNGSGEKETWISIYRRGDDTFVCSSSETPYLFTLSSYFAEKMARKRATFLRED